MLSDPDYILDEDAIATLQPSPRTRTRIRPEFYPVLLPNSPNSTTFVSEAYEIKRGTGPGRKLQKKKEVSQRHRLKEIRVDLETKWHNVLEKLCANYLIFVGKQGDLPSIETRSPSAFECDCVQKVVLTKTVRMYFLVEIKDVPVSYCSCKPLPEALMLMGMFPSSPSNPKSAIHLGLLGFFNEVRITLKSSSEGIAKLYNNLRGNPLQVMDSP
ncbi:hypothetical protein INT47_003718 [Mucor saturninus]|uniref:CxC1-like cysteine cluster associated with KDZ transposases domain-containing protein n=1 Tax=Mucor saturninus TaxID=64648 RepID=A0A8H7RBW1_9FUNG|nr:hypothetical protein INT47_003718 [Mucor saturninus]